MKDHTPAAVWGAVAEAYFQRLSEAMLPTTFFCVVAGSVVLLPASGVHDQHQTEGASDVAVGPVSEGQGPLPRPMVLALGSTGREPVRRGTDAPAAGVDSPAG